MIGRQGLAAEGQALALKEVQRPVAARSGGGDLPGGAWHHGNRPHRDVGVGVRGPRAWRWRRGRGKVGVAPGDEGHLDAPLGDPRDLFGPEHGEVRLDHLARGGQVQPDLEELGGVGSVLA